MSLPGPLPVAQANTVVNQEIGLRSFQRVTAQVLSVSGTTAVLSIEGHPVVAQLTSSDQAAALLSRSTAQFIVTQLTDQVVTLKFVKNDQGQAASTAVVPSGPELAVRLLDQNNMPVTVNNLMLARSMLRQHLPVTARLLNELSGVLSENGSWGEADAELAAAMKAAGLPVTAQSLKILSRQPAQMGESVSGLIGMLSRLIQQDMPPELLKQLKLSLQNLNALVINGEGETPQLAEQLKNSVELLGRSLESFLLEQSQNPQAQFPEKSLLSLVRLQQMLEQLGQKEGARAVRDFLADIQRNQFMNVKPDPVPGSGVWTEVGFMLQGAQQKVDQQFSSARLRIAHEAKSDSDKINPAYTRLILQVDLSPDQTVEVDLSLVGKQIRTSLMAPDPLWCDKAQGELPSLVEALHSLGYDLKDVQIGVGDPRPFGGIAAVLQSDTLMTVNIEV